MDSENNQSKHQQQFFLDKNSKRDNYKTASGSTFANLLRNNTNPNNFHNQQQINYFQLANNNHALAKRNSLMMTKIAKLEKKVSQLQAENMNLKRNNISDSSLRKSLLNDRLTIIEDIIHEKFGEIVTAFKTTREQEGLPLRDLGIPVKLCNNLITENNINRQLRDSERSLSSSSSPVSVSNSESPNDDVTATDTSKNIEKHNGKTSDKKRRSSRRQSIYISKESLQDTNHDDKNYTNTNDHNTDNYSLMENYGSTSLDSSTNSLGVGYGSHITPSYNNVKHQQVVNNHRTNDYEYDEKEIEIYNNYSAPNIHELSPSSLSINESNSKIQAVQLDDQSNIACNYNINSDSLNDQVGQNRLDYNQDEQDQKEHNYNAYNQDEHKREEPSMKKQMLLMDNINSHIKNVYQDDSLDKFSQIYNVSQSSMIIQENNKGKVYKDTTTRNIDERRDIVIDTDNETESTEYEPLNVHFDDIVVVDNNMINVSNKRSKSKSDHKHKNQSIQKSDSAKRRTRGKSVNYALPSLKTKMRRPSKENEIIQVKKSKRKSLTTNNSNIARKNRQPLKLLSNNT